MTILDNSRYENGTVVPQPDQTVAVRRTFPKPTQLYETYNWISSDRLDRLSADKLGGAENWWKIMDANPLIKDPNHIRPGQQIRLPVNA